MKATTTTTLSTALLAILFLLGSLSANGMTYTTLSDGAWSNTTNVWSTNGVTPCGCTPGSSYSGDDIIINHVLTMDYQLSIDGGSVVTISAGGAVSGSYNYLVMDGDLNVHGALSIAKFVVLSGSSANIINGLLNTTNRVEIYGSLLLDAGGLYMSSGNFNVLPGGTVNMMNGSEIAAMGGNISNDGNVTICSSCCLTTSGNWKNETGGVMSGSGAATTTMGNMTNDGVWDVNITWCSVGFDSGMPSPEDCSSSTSTCGATVLPAGLLRYDVSLSNGVATASWRSASSLGNDYFLIEKSGDGKEWTRVGTVDVKGTTAEEVNYMFDDPNPDFGITYYKLTLIDIDGETDYSVFRAVYHNESNTDELIVFPNPTNTGTVSVVTTENDLGVVRILDMNGKVLLKQDLNGELVKQKLDVSHLMKGVYLVQVEQSGKYLTKKLAIND